MLAAMGKVSHASGGQGVVGPFRDLFPKGVKVAFLSDPTFENHGSTAFSSDTRHTLNSATTGAPRMAVAAASTDCFTTQIAHWETCWKLPNDDAPHVAMGQP